MNFRLQIFSLILGTVTLPAGTLILDPLDQGSFSLSPTNPESHNNSGNWNYGSERFATLSTRHMAPGTTITSTLNDSDGNLTFAVDGTTTLAPRPLSLKLVYSGGGPFNILGRDAFELDLTSIFGSGFLIIELGGGTTAVYGPTTNRIPLSNPGLISVPFSKLNFGTSGSIEKFTSLHFTFEAETEQFSMTLDEIRVVPEPSSISLVMLGALSLLRRRRPN